MQIPAFSVEAGITLRSIPAYVLQTSYNDTTSSGETPLPWPPTLHPEATGTGQRAGFFMAADTTEP